MGVNFEILGIDFDVTSGVTRADIVTSMTEMTPL